MEDLENMKQLVKQELETQLNSFEDLEIGSDEQKKAMDEVRAQVINLSMIAACKIVEQKLGSEEDKKMASKIVDSIMK